MKRPRNNKLLLWAIGGFVWINLGATILHLTFELSEYYRPLAVVAAVNESAWEHIKIYFWSGLLLALVEYTYVRDVAHNYWFGKIVGLLVTPLVILFLFYFYLGIAFPIHGKGWLVADIATGAIGVMVGQYVSYRILADEQVFSMARRYIALALYIVMIAAFLSFTYYPPHNFIFESFNGYTYRGEYGIMEDYEPYRLFRPAQTDSPENEVSKL